MIQHTGVIGDATLSGVLFAPWPSGFDDRPMLQELIDRFSNAGRRGVVQLGYGTYQLAASLRLKSGVSLRGVGQEATTLQAIAGLTTTVLLGVSTDTVADLTLSDFTIDGNRTVFSTNVHGIQVTNGARIVIQRLRVENTRDLGIRFSGTPDVLIDSCYLFQCGKGGTNGTSIDLISGSHRAKVVNNTIIKNGEPGDLGFGIHLSDCDDCKIIGNYVEQATVVSASTWERSYEPIGFTSTCDRTVVIGNSCIRGSDNGISCSGTNAVIADNYIEGVCHDGVALIASSQNCVIRGNLIKNSSQHSGVQHAAISLIDCTDNVVVGNRCYDDQGTKTQAWGVRSAGAADFNTVVGNNCRGNSVASVSLVGANNVSASNLV